MFQHWRYILSTLKVHFINIEGTFYQHWRYILSTLKVHFINIEGTFYQHWRYILSTLKVHFINIEGTFYQHWRYILSTLEVHFINIEGTFYQLVLQVIIKTHNVYCSRHRNSRGWYIMLSRTDNELLSAGYVYQITSKPYCLLCRAQCSGLQ